VRAVCLHGHFYQPPREDPWLGVVEPEPSAAPFRDWNARITAECYAPNARARLLDAHGRLADVANTYAAVGFDFGPTLLSWLAPHAPDVLAAVQEGDAASRTRTGHGNGWAQAYGHAILPLSTARDTRTQVAWGVRDFAVRFGRAPDGMWLPEMAVDGAALEALAAAGVTLTMLSPHQARRVRPLGAGAWQAVTADTLETRRLYRCRLPSGAYVDIVFRNDELSRQIAFGALLKDGARLATALLRALDGAPEPALLTVAVDGETFGHHHAFAEMALAFALRMLAAEGGVQLTNPAAFRVAAPPAWEVEVTPDTSWSCAHGVERWRGDCGCHVGGEPGWTRAWRRPLRAAIDWLRDELAAVYADAGGQVLRDPWGARDRYVDCLLDPGRVASFLAAEASGPAPPARRALELARHALLMQTSCGWFFDELTGVEPVLILRHAARAIELAGAFGARLEGGFVERLAAARSNLPQGGTGADVYRRAVRDTAATPARVAATAAIVRGLGADPGLPGWEMALDGGTARLTELATGAVSTLVLEERPRVDGAPVWRVDGRDFGLADLFGVQRERLAQQLGLDAARAMRKVLADMRPVLDALLARDTLVTPEVAALLGWDAAVGVATALERGEPLAPLVARARAIRARGVAFPAEWLARRLTETLGERVAAVPSGAPAALALLELAEAADVALDLAPAQARMLGWWKGGGHGAADWAVRLLARRLDLAPDEDA
jgi:alpha-amylase/alpha-mannosidase (GH57 family)